MRTLVVSPWMLALAAIGLLGLVGCGSPGYANFPSNTKSINTTPSPKTGDFSNELDNASANGGDVVVTISADYVGTLTTGTTVAFEYPFTVTLDGAPFSPDSGLTFNATSVGSSPPSFFGELNIHFRNLGAGDHTVVVHFGTLKNFTGTPLIDETVPVTVSSNG